MGFRAYDLGIRVTGFRFRVQGGRDKPPGCRGLYTEGDWSVDSGRLQFIQGGLRFYETGGASLYGGRLEYVRRKNRVYTGGAWSLGFTPAGAEREQCGENPTRLRRGPPHANMAHIKQARPDPGRGLQAKVLKTSQVVPPSQEIGIYAEGDESLYRATSEFRIQACRSRARARR